MWFALTKSRPWAVSCSHRRDAGHAEVPADHPPLCAWPQRLLGRWRAQGIVRGEKGNIQKKRYLPLAVDTPPFWWHHFRHILTLCIKNQALSLTPLVDDAFRRFLTPPPCRWHVCPVNDKGEVLSPQWSYHWRCLTSPAPSPTTVLVQRPPPPREKKMKSNNQTPCHRQWFGIHRTHPPGHRRYFPVVGLEEGSSAKSVEGP